MLNIQLSPHGLPYGSDSGTVPSLFTIQSLLSPMSAKKFDLEKALSQLEKLVERLEQGDQPLETSLKAFEQGIGLVRECQQTLAQAEQKIRVLTANSELDIDLDNINGNNSDD